MISTPVIVLTEKDILMSSGNVSTAELPNVEVENRRRFVGEHYKSYDFEKSSEAPAFVNVGSDRHQVDYRFTP